MGETDMTYFTEVGIPSDIKKFVKSQLDDPAKIGILAMMIASFLKKNKESFETYEPSGLLDEMFNEGKGVADEDLWNDAKAAFKKNSGHAPESDSDFAIVTTIYKNMGGTFNKEMLEYATRLTVEFIEQSKMRFSTEVHGHRHTYTPGDVFSSTDDGHNHRVNGNLLEKANEHTHKLLSEDEADVLGLAERGNDVSNSQDLLVQQLVGEVEKDEDEDEGEDDEDEDEEKEET